MIDLSLLSPMWSVKQGQLVLTTSPQRIVEANTRRFAIVLCYFNNASPPDAHVNQAFAVHTNNPLQFGLVFNAGDFHTFEFTKYASLVTSEWWVRDSGANITPGGIMTVTEILQTANL